MLRALPFLLVPFIALAVPPTLHHQGRLASASGEAIEGMVDLDVGIYDQAADGVPLFTERFEDLSVVGGYFDVQLGAASTPLPLSVFTGEPRWVGVTVNDGTALSRTTLSSVPYALVAGEASRTVQFDESVCDAGQRGTLQYRDNADGLFLCNGDQWFRIGTGAPVPEWPHPAYAYRTTLTVQGSTGAGSGYAVRLRIGSQAGAGTMDLHLNGNADAFPTGQGASADFAFYGSDETTVLPFWVEEVSAGVATVWVRVAENLDSDRQISLYYGRSAGTTASDGTATFLLFDDFEAGSIDTAMWTVNGTASVSEGQLVVGNASTGHDAVDSLQTFAMDGLKGIVGVTTDWRTTPLRAQGPGFNTIISGTTKGGTYHYQVARPLDATGRVWVDGTSAAVGTDTNTTPAVAGWHSGTDVDRVQYVLVSPYVEPQPAVASTSSEEAQP
jgi:hypothetical protein